MASHRLSRAGVGALLLTLLACSAGDLTVPGSGSSPPDQPAALTVVSGDGQRAEAGTILDDPLKVEVLNERSEPVPNVPIQFSFLGDLSGAALDPTSVLTDADGRAEAIVRLGELAGEQIIVAEIADAQLPELRARFTATAVLPDDKGGGKKGGSGDRGAAPGGGT